jgi:monothiol glutaredoxin
MLAARLIRRRGLLGIENSKAFLFGQSASFHQSTLQSSDDTHDDFKPKMKHHDGGKGIDEAISKDVSSHSVFIYMKGHPEAPMCGFSNMACRILDAYGVRYGSRDVLADPLLREGIKQYTSWPTIPQIFVQGEFIGGM